AADDARAQRGRAGAAREGALEQGALQAQLDRARAALELRADDAVGRQGRRGRVVERARLRPRHARLRDGGEAVRDAAGHAEEAPARFVDAERVQRAPERAQLERHVARVDAPGDAAAADGRVARELVLLAHGEHEAAAELRVEVADRRLDRAARVADP